MTSPARLLGRITSRCFPTRMQRADMSNHTMRLTVTQRSTAMPEATEYPPTSTSKHVQSKTPCRSAHARCGMYPSEQGCVVSGFRVKGSERVQRRSRERQCRENGLRRLWQPRGPSEMYLVVPFTTLLSNFFASYNPPSTPLPPAGWIPEPFVAVRHRCSCLQTIQLSTSEPLPQATLWWVSLLTSPTDSSWIESHTQTRNPNPQYRSARRLAKQPQ